MRSLVFVLAVVAVLGSAHNAVADDTIKCNPNGDQLELNQCAYDDLAKQDAELNRLYADKMAALRTADAKARLKKAQQAWIKFRDTTCLYQVGPRGENNGSMWPMLNAACHADLTAKRVDDFKAYLACTTAENNCPL